ncbi:MAG: alpha/beta fold hydrolase [Cyanobacteria bacterium P01_A01_bin.123]
MLLVLLGVVLYGMHQLGVINAWQLPLKSIIAFWIGGSVACLLIGWFKPIRAFKAKRWWVRALLIGVISLNAIAFLSAYGMTHLCSPGQICVGLPRPNSDQTPADLGLAYTTQRLEVNDAEWIETWFIPSAQPSSGTVLLFPGNGGSKATQLLAPAQVFHGLGYDALLTDFRGVGGSSGQTTTLGTREAQDVALVMAQAEQLNLTPPLTLYGVSMGTAAIMNAIATQSVTPDAIVLELPFVRLVDSVKSRLRAVHVPPFPLAELIVFWGSIQHGFNGFTHNPIVYAQQINSPTLVFQGEQDKWISVNEVEALVQNLQGPKQLVVFPNAGHNLLVTVDQAFWQRHIQQFLKGLS